MAELDFGLGVYTHLQFTDLPSPATWIQATKYRCTFDCIELHGSTYMQMFFNSIDKYYSTPQSMGG